MRELRTLRLRRGLSQADLSAKTGVAEFTISEIEAGKRPNPRPSTLRKLAQGLSVEVADLYGEPDNPLGEAPAPTEQRSFNHLLEEEWRLRDLQGWRVFRAFVHGLARRWRESPPKTSAEIAPIFDTLTALAKQGVFESSEAPDMREVEEFTLIMVGFEKLNEIASKVEKDEHPKQQRSAVIRDIREKLSA